MNIIKENFCNIWGIGKKSYIDDPYNRRFLYRAIINPAKAQINIYTYRNSIETVSKTQIVAEKFFLTLMMLFSKKRIKQAFSIVDGKIQTARTAKAAKTASAQFKTEQGQQNYNSKQYVPLRSLPVDDQVQAALTITQDAIHHLPASINAEVAAVAKVNAEVPALTSKQYSIRIIEAAIYSDRSEALRQVKEIADQVEHGDSMHCLAAEYNGKAGYLTLLAIDTNNKIVGFLSGHSEKTGGVMFVPEDRFFVHLIAVNNEFSSKESCRSTEKVGTRLMFYAMEKARQLGETNLSLQFDLGDYGDPPEIEAVCKRKTAFYHNLSTKYHIPVTWHNDYNDGPHRNMRYDITDFQLNDILEGLKQAV